MATIDSEQQMLDFGEKLGESLEAPAVLELIGDVGVGKTTLTRGIAKALKIKESVTSPSFTISKRYAGKTREGQKITLAHYDFYRLIDPGIMSEELAETLNDESAITIIEWGESVQSLLPEKHIKIEIKIKEDGSREIIS